MWFRNLLVFRFIQPFALEAEALSEKLQSAAFQPCGKMERQAVGFCQPAKHAAAPLVHAVSGNLLLSLCVEDKILPAAVIRDFADVKVQEIEEAQGRKVGKKERKEIVERVTDELLPRAFTRRRKTTAMICPQQGWLIVDSASAKRAEELLEWLRKCVDTLAVRPLNTEISPMAAMTDWLTGGEAPGNFGMETEVELKLPEEDGAVIRCLRQDVHADEVRNHLASGKRVTKLALTWADRMSFVLTEDLLIRRLAYLDLLQDEAKNAGAVDADEQFDANLTIMAGELNKLLPELIEALGGEQQPKL
ncbi:MAG: recombination-associated protein RdgC [Chitinivorax sp.]|jgi:recombination associated protein RdgC